MSDKQDELAAVLQYLEEDERTARENGRDDLAERIATQRRRLLEAPSAELVRVFNDVADELETSLEAAGIDDILTGDTITYIRRSAKEIDPHDR
jgi:septation ring formation regulator EzrA